MLADAHITQDVEENCQQTFGSKQAVNEDLE